MKTRLHRKATTALLLGFFLLGLLAACGGRPSGAKLLNGRCDGCHAVEIVTSASKDQDGWKRAVDRMISYGARLDDGERDALIEYLTKNYP